MDDEDWYDYDNEYDALDDDEAALCPECGAAIYADLDHCPECGHWLTEADRRAMETDRSISGRVKLAAVVLLVALLVFVLVGGFLLF